ncbi:hypothetical protein EON81_02195 [bacterium]|nr:MAG: hypothetical protein EON81_02195 [bacterium]
MKHGKWPELALDEIMDDAVVGLKVCPLCDALNARGNEVCFVCDWRGEFRRDRETIEDGLLSMMSRFPELVEGFAPYRKPTFRERMGRWWQRVSSRP